MAKNYYRKIAAAIKKIDRMTNYKTGFCLRTITNINTRRYWDKKLSSYGETWRIFPYEYILDFLPKDTIYSVLDIGSGLGDGCLLFKRHFPQADVEGADFSKVAIEKSKRKTNDIKYFELDISKENPHRRYDYITLIHILEHFNDPYIIVDKCLSFVNKALIIECPYTEKIDEPRLYRPGQHRYLFNKNTFSRYNCTILKITKHIESAGYRYIIYKLTP